MFKLVVFIVVSTFLYSGTVFAEGLKLTKGNIGLELISYPGDVTTNQDDGNVSVEAQLELFSFLNDFWTATLTPFVRLDGIDENRNKFDLQDAYLNYSNEAWLFNVGIKTFSWSVTESVNTIPHHVADILNQRDLAGDSSGQEKLGTPMLSLGYQTDDGMLFEAFLLPWFREREYPAINAREHPFNGVFDLRGESNFTDSNKENRVSAALRFEAELGSANVAFIKYQGYALEPLLSLNMQNFTADKLYYLVDMTALTIQASLGTWLLKTETAYFDTSLNNNNFNVPENYLTSVSGFEYTFIRPSEKADLTFILEWMYDERGDGLDGVQFQDDVFLGFRWTANDLDGTEVVVGTVNDLDESATILHVEYKRRIQDSLGVLVTLRSFNAEGKNPVSALNNDDFINVKLHYYF